MRDKKNVQIGYGIGRFTLDKDGRPVKHDRRKKDRRICDKGLDKRTSKETKRKGVKV